VVRTPAWRRWLPPGPCAGCAGGVIARVTEGAADPVWSNAEPSPVQPAITSATARPATPRPCRALGLLLAGPSISFTHH
jgi:hypothetical protein